MAALAFLAGSTVLPIFISKLTESRILIGIFAHIEWFGWLFPQLLAAIFLAHKRRVLFFYNGLSVARLMIFGLSIVSIYFYSDDYSAILIAFGITFAVFSLVSGMAGAAFTEIVGKAIPLNKRGSFFGMRMFFGGLLAALVGLFVKKIMQAFPFPYDFGYLCSVAWILMFLGLACFALVREPEARQGLEKSEPSIQLKSAIRIFKNDTNFRKLIFSRAWANTALMASPFYVIFAVEHLSAPEWMAGFYLTIQMTGYLASNLLWGWLSNHISNKMVIVLAGVFRVAPPIMAFACCFFFIDPKIFALVFFFLGISEAGMDMGYMTYLLEISPEKGRILFIGLYHTFIAPTVFLSGIGGWFGQEFSLRWLFAVVLVTTIISLLISSRLRQPRLKSA